jgi:hypothetical protein
MRASLSTLPATMICFKVQCMPCSVHSNALHKLIPPNRKPYFSAGGASPRHIQQRLSHLSTGRQHARVTLSAAAVTAWLVAHPAAASGIASLSLDLSHHSGSSDFDTASLDRLLQKLPKVTRVTMAGAVEGTDAYEPIGGCRAADGCVGAVTPAAQRFGVWSGCNPAVCSAVSDRRTAEHRRGLIPPAMRSTLFVFSTFAACPPAPLALLSAPHSSAAQPRVLRAVLCQSGLP